MKLVGLFRKVSQDLLVTEMESTGTGNAVISASVFHWVLRNPNTGARFYTFNKTICLEELAVVTFAAYRETSIGINKVPSVSLWPLKQDANYRVPLWWT